MEYLEREAPFLANELLMLIEHGKLDRVPTHVRLLYQDMQRLEGGGGPGYIAELTRMQLRREEPGVLATAAVYGCLLLALLLPLRLMKKRPRQVEATAIAFVAESAG